MKKLARKILTIAVLLLSAPTALAVYEVPSEYQPSNIAESWAEKGGGEGYGARAVTFILGDLVSGLLGIVGVIAVYFLVSNALKYVSSFGEQDKLDQAKKGIFWAVGGLLIIILSYVIVRFVIKVVLSTEEAYL